MCLYKYKWNLESLTWTCFAPSSKLHNLFCPQPNVAILLKPRANICCHVSLLFHDIHSSLTFVKKRFKEESKGCFQE